MADWHSIQTEYVTTDASYRDLSRKYKVSLSAIVRHSQREEWIQLREHHRNKVTTQKIAAQAKKEIDRYTRLLTVADKLLAKIEESVDALTPRQAVVDKQIYRSLTGALKDIKDIQDVNSSTTDSKIEVNISNELREWAE